MLMATDQVDLTQLKLWGLLGGVKNPALTSRVP